ncbi:glycosyltransferase 87 family protein [Rhodopirellula sp. MGV]|uniref:glycosyltransferase 87 family protein n=1 Tax=Rhodopirellula sp. MGV TaxID=2023130 RepID=UPI000B95DE5F|nr:glycosyltransferase 87 family protein [Rhodopirellula sp. MGV]OYP38126.1 hypothetical protein CGZ80_02495 [Rhodopirellula sp. MGV]PNY38464.1 DUF2029 domain-containing protein [Rhodopirellula baltica]
MKPATSNKPLAAVAIVVFIALVSMTAIRVVKQYQVPGPFTPSAQGMCDFHNGIYFPTKALLRGVSPYGQAYADDYPVARQIPFFSPGILLLHAPFAMMPLHVAEVLYFVFCVGLIIAIAVLCADVAGKPWRVDWIACVACVLVASRGGHITLFDGYFTFELVLASMLAIHWAPKHPLWAAIALAVVSAKPTYILPLGFLLLARGNVKAIVIGAIYSVVLAAIPFGWLAYHEGLREIGRGDLTAGLNKVLGDIETTQQVHMNMPDESPVLSWTRLDLLAAVSKWTQSEPSQATHLIVMAAILAVPMALLVVRCRRKLDDGLGGATGAMILLATLTSLYHQSYDAMLMLAPITAAAAVELPYWKSMPGKTRWAVCALMLFPLFNLLSTRSLLLKLNLGSAAYAAATCLNGVSIATALGVVCYFAVRRQTGPAA